MMTASHEKTCIVCGSLYGPDVDGILRCAACGLLASGQKAGYGNPIQGMGAIARRNYGVVAKALAKAHPLRGTKVLDVGCADGGFTELMLGEGADCLGLEPDRDAAQQALAKNLPVQLTSFESYVAGDTLYDFIVFNDVFEHFQDPFAALEKSHAMLKPNGFILINAPVSTGFIFRMVAIAARLGVVSPYRRIWARGLSSPHIYFYSERNLRILLEKRSMALVDTGRLVALSTDGMYERVRTTYGPVAAFVISAVASVFAVVSSIFPGDVMYFVFKNNEK